MGSPKYIFQVLSVLSVLFLWSFSSSAQNFQWASKVVGVSSQKSSGNDPQAPGKVLGEPDALPLGQENTEAWAPKNEQSSEEYIEVSFLKSMPVSQVVVVENYLPGAISKIELVSTGKKRYTVYQNPNPGPVPVKFRVLRQTFEQTKYRVLGVVVTLQPNKVGGAPQIDAIGIAETEEEFVKKEFQASREVLFDSVMVNLGPNVNTYADELHPVISSDGKVLFFARQNHSQNTDGRDDPQDVWFSKLEDPAKNTWGRAQNSGLPINTFEANGVASVSPDGNSLLLINTYNADGTISPGGASITTRTKNGWSFPVKLNILNYYNKSHNVDYFLAQGGKVLLLAVERDDSEGDQDLYVSFLQKFGVWSKPVSLGKTINTKKAEFAPFLAADQKTLFFASEGHTGYGKSDIFYSKRLDDSWQNWSKPVNLGPKVNTPDWDAYYTTSAKGDYAYLVSTKDAINKSRDIFRIGLTEKFKPEPVILVTGRVVDLKTGEPLVGKVIYESLVTGEELGSVQTNPEDGSYTIVLPSGTMYGYLAEVPGYISVNESFDATEVTEYSEVRNDLKLVPIEVGQSVKLNNIFFAQSKYYLRESSFNELDRLVKIMKDNPNLEILIEGHTDNQGNSKLNYQLSLDRVNEVKKYLVSKGIAKNRMETKGWGDSKPIAPNTSIETRKQNRRVEFTILKK